MGEYNFVVEKKDNSLVIITVLRINKSIFLPNQFQDLKKFFAIINQLKEAMIVLKKP